MMHHGKRERERVRQWDDSRLYGVCARRVARNEILRHPLSPLALFLVITDPPPVVFFLSPSALRFRTICGSAVYSPFRAKSRQVIAHGDK